MAASNAGEEILDLALLRAMYENAADAILTIDGDSIRTCNRAAESMFGLPRDVICEKSVLSLSPPLQPDGRPSQTAAKELAAAALRGEPQSFEWYHLRADGTPFPTEITLNRVPVKDRLYLQAYIRDITLRKMDEAELREAYGRITAAEKEIRRQYAALAETEEMFRNPVEHSPVGVYLQQDGIIRYANPRFAEMFGYTQEDLVNQPFDRIVDPNGRLGSCPLHGPASASDPSACLRHGEFSGRRKDGTPIMLEILEAPMSYKGRPAYYGNLVDVTQKKRAEATVRGLLDATRDQTVLTDNDGKILAVNEAFAAAAGRPAPELIGTIIYELIRTGGISMKMADEMQQKGTVPISFEEQVGDRWFDNTIYSINDADGVREQVAVFRHEITALKNAERDLLLANEQMAAEKERLALFASALDNMRDCAVITRGMGEIVYINATFEKRFGCTADGVAGKKLKDLAHPENQFQIGDSFFFDYKDSDRQGLFLGKNQYGVKIPLTITGKPIQYYNKKPTYFVFVLREKMG